MFQDDARPEEDEVASAYAEPDPEADLPDPERDLPNVPSVDVPSVRTSGVDVPGELRRDFWTTVAVLNVAVLALCVGAMMLAFGVERPFGAGILAVGLLSLLRGHRKFRALEAHQAERRGGEPSSDERNG